MRSIFLNSKATVAIILVISLFVLTNLQSCDKAKQFEGTTWESSSFKVSEELYNPWEDEFITVEYTITVTISFNKDDANVVARASFIDPNTDFPTNSTVIGTAKYTYKKKDMSVNVTWNVASVYGIDNGNWKGTVNNTTMTLNNVFNQTVTFTKK